MNTQPQRYCLVSDDDGHHYVIEAEHHGEWYELDDDQINAGQTWAWQVGGAPSAVTFTDPEIFGKPIEPVRTVSDRRGNHITGHVTGTVVQAGNIDGGLRL